MLLTLTEQCIEIKPDPTYCVCRYNVVTPPDGAFGGQRPNGSWTGMMGQVTLKVRLCASGNLIEMYFDSVPHFCVLIVENETI